MKPLQELHFDYRTFGLGHGYGWVMVMIWSWLWLGHGYGWVMVVVGSWLGGQNNKTSRTTPNVFMLMAMGSFVYNHVEDWS